MNTVARDLIAAFQAAEQKESAAVLLDEDDGFDIDALRILAAWPSLDLKWHEPPNPCPDGGRPTARAFAWLVRGAQIDYVAVADAAGVSRYTARVKLAVLLANRLVYPDGQIAGVAKVCLQASIAKRVRKLQSKPKTADAN